MKAIREKGKNVKESFSLLAEVSHGQRKMRGRRGRDLGKTPGYSMQEVNCFFLSFLPDRDEKPLVLC